MRLFYWNRKPNLGDALNRILFPGAEWAAPREADFVAIGSVLEHFDGFTGTVFGTGRGGPSSPPTDLSRARVLALRGMETRKLTLGVDDTVLGDPGLLASRLVGRGWEGGYVAVVPHWQDQARMLTMYPGARFVDVTGSPWDALRTIANAERVVSSSLHGIVLADAFHIPRMWEWFDGVQGRGFKFRDHGSVVGEFEPGEWKQPSVLAIKSELTECLSDLAS